MAFNLADVLGDFDSDESQTIKLNVFTLNVWGRPLHLAKDKSKRIEAIGQFLARRDYDVVCLQELWLENDYKIICRAVKDNLPFTHFFKSGLVGSGICTLSKWPIVNTFFHKWRLNGYPHMLHRWDWYADKGIGLVQIVVNGLIVHVHNTHLLTQYSEENDRHLIHRMTQGYETANFIKVTSEGAACSLLLADLNSQPEDIVHRTLCKVANLKDTHDKIGNSILSINYGTYGCKEFNRYADENYSKKHPFGVRLNYIMYTSDPEYKVDVLSHKFALPHTIPGTEISFSDHEAVEATILFEPRTEHDPPEQADVSTLCGIADEMVSLCEQGKDLVWKNSYFFRALLICAIIFFIFFVCHGCPMTFVSILFLGLYVMIGTCALFMVTIWNKLEIQKISGMRNDVMAFRTHLAFSESHQPTID